MTGEHDTARSMGLGALLRRTRSDPGLRRETDMMGFYLAIALLVALTATGSDHAPHTQTGVLIVVWGTTVGMGLAHWFAVVVAMRLVDDPTLRYTPTELLTAQMVMGIAIAVIATLVVLILGPDVERLGARVVAATAIAVIVGGESRASGARWRTSIIRAGFALVVGLLIAVIKWRISK